MDLKERSNPNTLNKWPTCLLKYSTIYLFAIWSINEFWYSFTSICWRFCAVFIKWRLCAGDARWAIQGRWDYYWYDQSGESKQTTAWRRFVAYHVPYRLYIYKSSMYAVRIGIMCDLLWSDPQELNGRSPSKRGVGCQFGPDITEKFCKTNNIDYIVRCVIVNLKLKFANIVHRLIIAISSSLLCY